MSNNGHPKLDWLDQARVYAALAADDDPQQVHMLLAREGLALPPRSVAEFQRQGQHKIHRMRESGFASALLGLEARRFRRVTRLDSLCEYLEERIQKEPMPLDRELAALLQQYRELMSFLFAQDGASLSTEGNGADPGAAVAATLTLLEALNYDELPPGDSATDLCDAARRLAAATGFSFAETEPGQSPMAADDGDLRAAAGSGG